MEDLEMNGEDGGWDKIIKVDEIKGGVKMVGEIVDEEEVIGKSWKGGKSVMIENIGKKEGLNKKDRDKREGG